MHLEFPIVSFISAALALAPLPWHWRAGTIPTISIALWLFISNIISGVNSIIWAGNVRVVVPVWCDITTKILVGANVALPASVFCLCVHLERVSSVRQISTGFAQKRRRQYCDMLICFGIPLIYMALHYVVQGHRFDLVENLGCRASIYVSIASVFLISIPPLFFSLGSFILSGLAFRNFWVRRITFARHLQNSTNSALTPSRYFRLMSMSLVQMFWGFAITVFNMWFTMKRGLRPWINWQNVHFGFSRIGFFPTLVIPPKELLCTYIIWWTIPISTILFFVFFAFGQDAMKEYRACYIWIKRIVFRVSDPSQDRSISVSLPSYVQTSDPIKLSPVNMQNPSLSDSKSETTLSPSSYKTYQWDPLPSAASTLTSPTFYASSIIDDADFKPKPSDSQSWTDTKSLSSYCSTARP